MRDSSIVSLHSSSLSSSLRIGHRFAPFHAGLLGVGGMLLKRPRMANRRSMTADLDITSLPVVGMLRAVVLVFVVFCGRSRAVAVDGP